MPVNSKRSVDGRRKMSASKTKNWKVRPGYAFTAGAGLGGGLFVFEFLNADENRIYGMGFGGLGLAGGVLGGKWSTAKEAIKKLATQAALKGAGRVVGIVWDAAPGFKNQIWSPLTSKRPFSSEDLNDSTGRVTILGASAANVGYYKCYISASDGVVSWTPLFGSVSVDVRPQKLNIQIGTILGLWWEAFDVPNS
jgi:hypothetical protein